MLNLTNTAKRAGETASLFLRDRRGATAIEYGLLVAMLAIALVGILTLSDLGKFESQTFQTLSDNMAGGGGSTTP